jgi:hypothetical protein
MNDPNATQAQVAESLRDIVEGITPLALTTAAILIAMIWKELSDA